MSQLLPSSRPSIPALTSARFLAAFWVICGHFLVPVLPASRPDWVVVFLNYAQVAVSFFFVLSGFVLTYSQVDSSGRLVGSRTSFWISRFSRIYPVYFLAFCVAFWIVWYLVQQNPAFLVEAVCTLLLVQAWNPWFQWMFNGPGWTISVEAFFYLVFPWAALYFCRLSVPRSLLVLAALSVVAVVPRMIFTWVAPVGPDDPQGIYNVGINFWTSIPLFRLPEFLAGMIAARLVGERAADPARKFRGIVPNLVVVALLVGLVVALAWPVLPLLVYAKIWLVTPLLVAIIVSLAITDTVVGRLLSLPFAVVLGNISYSIYILQMPVYSLLASNFAARYGYDFNAMFASPRFFGAFMVILFVASFASYYLFETPVRRLIQRIARRMRGIPVRMQIPSAE